MRTVVLDGKAYRMRDIERLYKEQRQAIEKVSQPTLFELKDDARPTSQRTPQGRFAEPTLFD